MMELSCLTRELHSLWYPERNKCIWAFGLSLGRTRFGWSIYPFFILESIEIWQVDTLCKSVVNHLFSIFFVKHIYIYINIFIYLFSQVRWNTWRQFWSEKYCIRENKSVWGRINQSPEQQKRADSKPCFFSA